MSDLARLGYDASLRSLDKQEELLGELRSRTGIILAASSLAASFLGRPALDAELASFAYLALVAFVISLAASLYVLVPKENLIFSLVGSALYEQLYEFREDLEEAYRRLAYDLDRFWESNNRTMRRVVWGVRIAAGGLAAEILLLLVSLTGTLD